MTLSASYARALFDLVSKDDSKAEDYLKNLRAALERRGHQKLLPRILSDYQKLEVGETRQKVQNIVSPEAERTRNLLELYRKLTTSHE